MSGPGREAAPRTGDAGLARGDDPARPGDRERRPGDHAGHRRDALGRPGHGADRRHLHVPGRHGLGACHLADGPGARLA